MPAFNLKQVNHLLVELAQNEFYGNLEIKFKQGKVVQMTKLESISPNMQIDINIMQKST
jgi:hypothetical protein